MNFTVPVRLYLSVADQEPIEIGVIELADPIDEEGYREELAQALEQAAVVLRDGEK